MNTINAVIKKTLFGLTLGGAGLLLAACAPEPVKDPGAARVRAALTDLQADPNLASRAPVAMHDAEIAVKDAELPQTDPAVSTHLVYVADRRVQIATAQAQTRYAEDQRKTLTDENSRIQLDARTREADLAKRKNSVLQTTTAFLQAETDSANRENDALKAKTDAARLRNDALEAELAALQAKKTDRGMVLTLGDLLFTTGRADLKAGGISNLDRLVTFLDQAPDRSVRIEGHTDNRGSESLNAVLSQRRADSVADYLTGRGINSSRVTAVGEGYAVPIADNNTEAGRQANRRVEVIIQNPTE